MILISSWMWGVGIIPIIPVDEELWFREVDQYTHSPSVINAKGHALATIPVPLQQYLLNWILFFPAKNYRPYLA